MLDKCCGMKLKTGGIVIGWIGVVGALLFSILVGYTLSNADVLANWYIRKNESTDVDNEALAQVIVIICVISLAMLLIGMVTSSLLILGAVKGSSGMLLPWLIQSGIGLVCSTISNVFSLFQSVSIGDFFSSLIFVIPTTMLQYYIYYAVYSLYKQLRDNRAQPPSISRESTVYAKVGN